MSKLYGSVNEEILKPAKVPARAVLASETASRRVVLKIASRW